MTRYKKTTSRKLILLCFFTPCFLLLSCSNESQPEPMANDQAHAHHQMASEESGANEMPAGTYTDASLYQVESSWTTQDAEVIQLSDLQGQFQIVAMTYTSCEFSCPLIVAAMKKILKEIPESHVKATLISIDPARDTPDVMKAFATKTNLSAHQWTLLQGDPDDVMEMAALLGVRYKKMEDGEYSHSNIITILNPAGEIIHQQQGLAPDQTTTSINMLRTGLSQ